MFTSSDLCSQPALRYALEVIGGRWKALILCELDRRELRYHELAVRIPDVTHRILTYELRALERKGVLDRCRAAERGRCVRYSLTSEGRALIPVLRLLSEWSQNYHLSENNSDVISRDTER